MIGECSVSASDWQKPPRITDGRRHAIGPGDPENHRDVHHACKSGLDVKNRHKKNHHSRVTIVETRKLRELVA